MNVIVAEHLGMCFGVRKALDMANAITHPEGVTMHGEIVHNPQILARLASRGFVMQPENERPVPLTAEVLITAHGVSERERSRLLAAGKLLHDTTCPLVRRLHKVARMLADSGYFVIVIGKPGHVEIEGLTGDLGAFEVVPDAASARHYGHARLGVVCQTTTAPSEAQAVLRAIQSHNADSEIRFLDTICHPTKARQTAVHALLPRIEALIVVGGRNSNNTRKLGELAEQAALPWFHVETAADVDPGWARRFSVVGLTAGTSTPDETIHQVHQALLSLRGADECA
jgi:4-hydroxy-3-methylbut-2-enyl diphosphate reductase